ncbi:MAG: hypothetical protein ACTHON_00875 [Humibacter sp.]
MTENTSTVVLRIGWICLAIVSVGIFAFGIIVIALPMGADRLLYAADGLASIGLGLFGGLLTLIPYRRRETWAWWALWFYPAFWTAHLVFGLPPGTDHVHQYLFIALSLIGLLLPVTAFFGSAGKPKG